MLEFSRRITGSWPIPGEYLDCMPIIRTYQGYFTPALDAAQVLEDQSCTLAACINGGGVGGHGTYTEPGVAGADNHATFAVEILAGRTLAEAGCLCGNQSVLPLECKGGTYGDPLYAPFGKEPRRQFSQPYVTGSSEII